MTRAVWIDAGNEARSDLTTRYGITQVFYDARWIMLENTAAKPQGALEYLKSVQAKGFQPGVYICSQGSDSLGAWPSAKTLSGPEWADIAYDWVQKKIAPGTSGSFPLVDLNCEVDDPAWILAMGARWRQHSPRRFTSWSMCAHKYPLFKDSSVQIGVLFNLLKPQCYEGAMQRVESASELDGWQSIGIPRERIAPMLDGAQLGDWWGSNAGGATAYTQGRLL